MVNDIEQFAKQIRFRFIKPHQKVPKGYHRANHWLTRNGLPFDLFNTKVPGLSRERKKALTEICRMPRMSTFAIGVLINQIVYQMRDEEAYLNIGVWNGFSLLSGMIMNGNKSCIGIDNFSMWGGPREAFMNRFSQNQSPHHTFYETDYEDYLLNEHKQPLGFYFYDGNHTYEHQKKGLSLAERFFAQGCIVMVDDTNWEDPRQATMDFMKESSNDYRVILDVQTNPGVMGESSAMHPTYWNGILLIQKIN